MPGSAERPAAAPTPDGLLVVDKPTGWTSHDVVARARRLCATRKVGHAGTLDPMATGVLVLGVGRATRLLTHLVGCDKDYTATVRLGQATLTDDAEGEVTAAPGASGVDRADVERAVAALTGDIQQVPSAVSAIKVKGERAYHRVRSGEDVELPARPVTVSRFVVGDLRTGDADGTPVLDVDVEVTVSSGTYVRALARDLGTAVGSAGHLTALRRTRVGGFGPDTAHPLADLEARQGAPMPVVALAEAARASFLGRSLTADEARAVGFGQRVVSSRPGHGQPVAAFAPDGTLVALLDESGAQARSLVVFAPASS
ncbi:tRNA pseudouridine(55) synthase TruB [Phycicoccus sp. CSK15P-2]|uniref:tRNA pseudouridine(55) synthase TruB n=1 Tax=Phycicoccus sp. CSK15P-2 TaxID=2807627 RepID=UPI00194E409D|nr:tRNA pseudouridine(55) synthase TruB [Phycicoccus sp. CSK15P-2]MBM6404687.1 tRNA pseudouridine(55) synthase TruB [Phycicoccus sp. CSK15P-2]